MDIAVRPHNAGTVLTLGLLSLIAWLLFVPLGVVAWIMGSRELRAMNAGLADPSGRTLVQAGRICGIVSTCAWLILCLVSLFFMPATSGSGSSSWSDREGWRRSEVYYDSKPSERQLVVEYQFEEIQAADGSWIKDGLSSHWSRDGKKLEEGTLRQGKRTGHWTFWNDDGSIDAAKTGVYENDIKVLDQLTPENRDR